MTQTQWVVERDLNWVFREQPKEDFGIDAHIEVVDNDVPLGLLLAVQVKGGPSQFRSSANGGWWFRETPEHFEYWLGHSIPVIIVLADLNDQQCYWQLVTKSTVVEVPGRNWKLRVPRDHVLNASAVPALREIAKAGALRTRERGPIGVAVSSLGLAAFEVHAAFSGSGTLSAVPPAYVLRAHDARLDELIKCALGPGEKSGVAVLVASSAAGKTRALYEALHRQIETGIAVASLAEAGWRVWPSVNPLPPSRFLEELAWVGPRTVVWLNEAQRYLREPSSELRAAIATGLRELLADDSRGPVLVLGTLWQEFWNELTRKPDAREADEFVAARRLLEGSYLRVPDLFTNTEVIAAQDSADPQLAEAAKRVIGSGVTQYLAGKQSLLMRYETASVAQRAIIHAAMDARRLGHREYLSEAFLSEVARFYLPDSDRARAADDPGWFDTAVSDLMRPGVGSGPVLHRSVLGVRLDDLLDEEGRASRRFEFPPDGFWTVAVEGDLAPDNRMRLAASATARLRLQIAARLYEAVGTEGAGRALHEIAMLCERAGDRRAAERLAERAAAASFPDALMLLAMSRYKYHGENEPFVMGVLERAAERGDVEALNTLARTMEWAGDRQGAEALAWKAVDLGSWKAMCSVVSWRDIEFPDEAEKLIAGLPEHMRLAAQTTFAIDRDEVSDRDGAERLALTLLAGGDAEAVLLLAERRAEAGRRDEAGRLLDLVGLPRQVEEVLRLAMIRVRAGDHVEARRLVALVVGARTRSQARTGLDPVDVGDRLVAFAQLEPQAVRAMEEVLRALDENQLQDRLYEGMSSIREDQPVLESEQQDIVEEDSYDEPENESDIEVANAYATLAEFHAKRGEFQESEELAFRAAAAGTSEGLEFLSGQLSERDDRKGAERLALCAVNMASSRWWGGSGEAAWTTLAEAREDKSVLARGLDADGTTDPPPHHHQRHAGHEQDDHAHHWHGPSRQRQPPWAFGRLAHDARGCCGGFCHSSPNGLRQRSTTGQTSDCRAAAVIRPRPESRRLHRGLCLSPAWQRSWLGACSFA